jgi:PBP1b-binding outer membrane lipoprotein LpoB
MKKVILIFLLAIFIISCSSNDSGLKQNTVTNH